MIVKAFLTRFSNEYAVTFLKCRLMAQIPLFVIALLTVFEIGERIQSISQTENMADETWVRIKEVFAFLLIIATIFFSQFLLLFSKAKTAFWSSQILWLISLVALYSAAAYFRQGSCLHDLFPVYGQALTFSYLLYMSGSPLYQLILLIFSLNRVFFKINA
jgi:hypothetical protein